MFKPPDGPSRSFTSNISEMGGCVMIHKGYIGIPVVLLAMTVTVAASAEPLRIAKVGDRMGSLVAGLTKVNGGPPRFVRRWRPGRELRRLRRARATAGRYQRVLPSPYRRGPRVGDDRLRRTRSQYPRSDLRGYRWTRIGHECVVNSARAPTMRHPAGVALPAMISCARLGLPRRLRGARRRWSS